MKTFRTLMSAAAILAVASVSAMAQGTPSTSPSGNNGPNPGSVAGNPAAKSTNNKATTAKKHRTHHARSRHHRRSHTG